MYNAMSFGVLYEVNVAVFFSISIKFNLDLRIFTKLYDQPPSDDREIHFKEH